MIEDDLKEKALELLPELLQNDNDYYYLTTYEDKPFLIVGSWEMVGRLNKQLNEQLSPDAFKENEAKYNNDFHSMRLATNGHAPYLIPEGLFDLEDVIEYGFDDEWSTCMECYNAIKTSISSYDDIPRYAIIDEEIFCDDCIREELEDEYIQSVMNNPKTALKTSIISEERLEELGWTKLEEIYENGLRLGQNDNPKEIFKKLKTSEINILFTYQPSQFDLTFWAWTKPSSSDDDDE